MKTIEKMQSPTPKRWKKIGKIAGIVATAAGALLLAPITLPAAIATGVGVLAFGAGILAGVSSLEQIKVEDLEKMSEEDMLELYRKLMEKVRPLNKHEKDLAMGIVEKIPNADLKIDA